MWTHKAHAIWDVAKKYYHATDSEVVRCLINLTMPYENSRIACEYKGDMGGISKLSFEDVVFLFDELKKQGVADIANTQGLTVTLEAGRPVMVEQSYYL